MDHIHPIFDRLVQREERQRFLNQKAAVYWFTGLSGSGKSTIVGALERQLLDRGYFSQVLDGDNMRQGVCSNLTFSIEDRKENIRRIAEVAKLYNSSGIITLCSFISPTTAIRSLARDIIGELDFHEIYVKADLSTCEARDVKGLYRKARAGQIPGFTGIDSPYEEPSSPALTIDTNDQTLHQSVALALGYIIQRSSMP